uniref:Neurotransmitter-gated ion-channel transmembrane domain-containing protein n=1 Tax=Fundulus heteroclitus TaxID=8078 RepID=A0A3Q2PVR2_FUNHE
HRSLHWFCLFFLGITTVLTMSTIITGVNASMPRVSYIKAVDVYLWISFVFVFLSVIEYAAVNYLSTLQERKEMRLREKVERIQNNKYVHVFVCTPSKLLSKTALNSANIHIFITQKNMVTFTERRVRNGPYGHVGSRAYSSIWIDTHAIDKYSRVIFPGSYILFNIIYWSIYS